MRQDTVIVLLACLALAAVAFAGIVAMGNARPSDAALNACKERHSMPVCMRSLYP